VGLIGAVTGCGGDVTDDAPRSSAAGGAAQVAVHGGRGPIGGRSATGGVTGSGGLGPTGGAGGAADVCGAILEGCVAPALAPCEFWLGWPTTDGRVADYWSIQITVTPSVGPSRILTRASNSSCTDGEWHVWSIDVDGNPEVVRLCPDLCTTLDCDTGLTILLTLGCA
jgi:hypothetical protein